MSSQLRAPSAVGQDLSRTVQKIYDDLNSVVDTLNTDLKGLKEPLEQSMSGSVAVVKEGDKYSLRGKTADGWAKVNIRLLNDSKIEDIDNSNKFTSIDNIGSITDSTGGTVSSTISNTTGVAVNSSASTVVTTLTEFENAIASVSSKINELIVISNIHNDIINTILDKVNEIIRRIDE